MIHRWFLLASLLLTTVPAWASRQLVTVQTNTGTLKMEAHLYQNAWGRREVRLESRFVGSLQGFGRDTDDDGRVDTWFMLDHQEGIQIHHLPSQQAWGLDVVQTQLFRRYRSSKLASLASAYGSVMSSLMVSSASAYSSQETLWRELIDLEEFSLRLKRSKENGEISGQQWTEASGVLMTGFDTTVKRFERSMGTQYWTLVAADIGLWVTGGIIFKGVAKAMAVVGRPIEGLPVISSVKEVYQAVAGKFVHRYRRELARLRVMRGVPAKLITTTLMQTNFPTTLRSLMGKNMLLRKVLPPIARAGIGMKKATLGWRYIAFMGGLQLTTESFANYDEVKSADPTEFAKNVLTHPDIIQNVGFMTSDAYFMTVASHSIRRPKLKFATCGFIAMSNSGITNFVIKGEKDYKRVALDTSWEAIIGNAQIQLDLKALAHFEKMAAKNNNPRLKLIGWAVVLVDQAAGFAAYSTATAIIENERKNVQLVPIHVLKN